MPTKGGSVCPLRFSELAALVGSGSVVRLTARSHHSAGILRTANKHASLFGKNNSSPETAGEAVILSPRLFVASNSNSLPASTTKVVPSVLLR